MAHERPVGLAVASRLRPDVVVSAVGQHRLSQVPAARRGFHEIVQLSSSRGPSS